MLKIVVPDIEQYDEATELFIASKEQILHLEHSLVSLSKWESKWEKAFLTKDQKTVEETIDYIRCMTTTQNVDMIIYNGITNENMDDVRKYIDAKMTATTFPNTNSKQTLNRETITSELIYYWMVALTIPFECQKWHLNRLLTLINVCNIKNAPPKKMGKQEIMRRNAELNNARRQSLNSGG